MITNLVEGKMKVNRKTQTHVQDCDSCSTQAQWVQQITAAISSRDLVDAPEFVVSRAVSAFQRKNGSWVQIVKAVLRFDSWAEPIAAGVRSQEQAPRQLMYETEGTNIFFDVASVVRFRFGVNRANRSHPAGYGSFRLHGEVESEESRSFAGEDQRCRRILFEGAFTKAGNSIVCD